MSSLPTPNSFSFVTTIHNGNEIMRIASIRSETGEPSEEMLQILNSMFNMPILPEDIINSIEQEIMNQSFEEELPKFQGASQYVIDTTLGRSKCYKKGTWKDEKCSICLTEFETETESEKSKRFYIRELPCCKQNKFHKRCIDKWFRCSSFSCPCCRKKFAEPEKENENPETQEIAESLN